jgi:hypothetical protein
MEENLNRIVFAIIAPSNEYSQWVLEWMHGIHHDLETKDIIERDLVRYCEDPSSSAPRYLFNFVVKENCLDIAQSFSQKIQHSFTHTIEKPSEDIILIIVCAKFMVEQKIGLRFT